MEAKSLLETIIAISLGAFIMALMVPMAISQAYSANTTGWETSVKTMWTILVPVMIMIVAVLAFFYIKRNQ